MDNRKIETRIIRRDGKPHCNRKMKKIVMTVYSNSDWILLAKPTGNCSTFMRRFSDEVPSMKYSVKTKGHTKDTFFPFISDDYIILASGEMTSQEGQKVEVELCLNDNKYLESQKYTPSLDFVLLTKDRREQKKKMSHIQFLSNEEVVAF